MEKCLGAGGVDDLWAVEQPCNTKLGYYTYTSDSTTRSSEYGKYTLIGSHEWVVVKHLSTMFEASALEMFSLSGQTSRHSSVLGCVTSTPLVATESRKHVASSEDSFEGAFETKGGKDTSDRKGKEAGVSVRP